MAVRFVRSSASSYVARVGHDRSVTGGPLLLVGGNEFLPGNEPHDLRFADAAGEGPAYVIATAAARQGPDRAVRTATRWFEALGLGIEELPLRTRRQANDPAITAAARAGPIRTRSSPASTPARRPCGGRAVGADGASPVPAASTS